MSAGASSTATQRRRDAQRLGSEQKDLLGAGIFGSARGDPNTAQPHQRGACPLETRLARHIRLIEHHGEARRLGEAAQCLTPCVLVRRAHEHAIHIKNCNQ